MSYVTPRSIMSLEQEIEELERQATSSSEQAEEPDEGAEVTQGAVDPPKGEVKEPLSKEEETFKKRYSDLRRHSQKLADDLAKTKVELEELKAQKEKPALPSAEEAREWAEKNPKAAAIIRALASAQTTSTSDELTAIKQKLTKAEEEARIRKVHSDFEDITASDDFHDWAESQPESVQKLIYSTHAEDVIWALGQFKKETRSEDPKKAAAKAVVKTSSPEPKVQAKGRFSESAVQKMSLQEYEKNEAAIQEEMKNGTFIYDLSGAAR